MPRNFAKRALPMALWIALLLLSGQLRAGVQPTVTPPKPLVLSKDAGGPITPVSLSLTLRSNPRFDATKALIPDGSKLVSNNFSMTTNARGIGTFHGTGRIAGPTGQTIVGVVLRGTVGLTANRGAGQSNRAPGHLEGMIEAVIDRPPDLININRAANPAGSARIISPIPPPPFLQVNFAAVELPTAGPVPIYRARLDGLILLPPPSPEGKVRIVPNRSEYGVDDPVIAIITNGLKTTIRIFDEQSYCTVVQLQKQSAGAWEQVVPCMLERIAFPTYIKPGEALKVSLPPVIGADFAHEPGTYRLAVTYDPVDAENNSGGPEVTVISVQFVVSQPPADGAVTVATDRRTYGVDSRIRVKIENGTDQAIQAPDHQSYCTIVTLQRQDSDSWTDVAPCPLLSPTRLIKIGARTTRTVALPPEPATPNHEPGTYRVKFSYSVVDASGDQAGEPVVLYTSPFQVGAVADPRSG